MRALAFEDASARRRLEAILHPMIGAEARRQGIAVRVEPAAAPLQVHADRVLLEQVVINLLRNAADAATMNGDKLSTLHYFFTLSQQHSMLWVGTGLMPSNSKAATRNDVNYVGSFSGLMTVSPSDASPDEIPPGDIATAQAFGKRVAEVAAACGTQDKPMPSGAAVVRVCVALLVIAKLLGAVAGMLQAT